MNEWEDFSESDLWLIRDALENSLESNMHYYDMLRMINEIDEELKERGVVGD